MDTLDLTDERLKRILAGVREIEARRVSVSSGNSASSLSSGSVDFSSLASSSSSNSSNSGAMPDFLSALAGANSGSSPQTYPDSSSSSSSSDEGTKRILDRLGNRIQELDEQLSRISERLMRIESGAQGRYS